MVTFNFYCHAEATKGIFPKGRLFTTVQWSQVYHLGMKMTYTSPTDMQRAQLLKHYVIHLILMTLSGMRAPQAATVLVQAVSHIPPEVQG